MNYLALKAKHQNDVDNFPMFFAFNKNQFSEGMKKLGLEETETSKLLSVGGGGFIRKSDADAFESLFVTIKNESVAARNDYDYLVQMFNYELNNHEYCYTWDLTDTLNSLELTIEEVNNNPAMKKALCEAIDKCRFEDQAVQ